MTPLEQARPVAWMCELAQEDGTTRVQFVTEDPAGIRWNDSGEPSPFKVTPLFGALSAQEVPQPSVTRLMILADEYANLAATAFAERLYGTSRDYTKLKADETKAARAALESALTAAPAAPKQEAWKCEAVTADFSDGTITLHVKTPGWHVEAGEYLLIPPAAPRG